MKYRAQLIGGPVVDRPMQVYGDDLAVVSKWAKAVLEIAPDGAVVEIYQLTERLIEQRTKP